MECPKKIKNQFTSNFKSFEKLKMVEKLRKINMQI